ncbi:hypothetical protein EUTSA_v10000266mg [Eutrema salsugineum]|uniref:Uncharacterized protein n=1 Tax=Eutrema salsugineum TaxID=72664 RepID=V4LQG4_EUTSA|nr:hypothetical protein EUTSA_v10000266mg [Eutrema salsugineum]
MNPCEDEYFFNHLSIYSDTPLQPSESLLSDDLRNFRLLLKCCALDHSSSYGKAVSYLMFVVFTLLVPLMSCLSIKTPETPPSPVVETKSFNVLVQFPESGLALIGFLTLVCFFRVYCLRQLLFLDDFTLVKLGFSRELDKALRCMACILLPSFLVEIVHKSIFFSSAEVSFPFIESSCATLNFVMFLLVLFSWVYRTGVFLLVCVLFRLTCELLILRFRGLHKMFDRCGSDTIEDVCKEHARIKKQLSSTSHSLTRVSSTLVIWCSALRILLVPVGCCKNNTQSSRSSVHCNEVAHDFDMCF